MDLWSLGPCCWTSGEGKAAVLFHLNHLLFRTPEGQHHKLGRSCFLVSINEEGKCVYIGGTLGWHRIPDPAGGTVRLIWIIWTSGLGNDNELRNEHRAAHFDSPPPFTSTFWFSCILIHLHQALMLFLLSGITWQHKVLPICGRSFIKQRVEGSQKIWRVFLKSLLFSHCIRLRSR